MIDMINTRTADPVRQPTGLSIALASTIGFLALVGSLLLGDAEPRPPVPGIPDPGVLVGWLVPAATLTANLAAITTVGFLALAALLVPSPGPDAQGLAVDAVRIARRAAWTWVLATIVLFVATAADVFAVTLGQLRFGLLVALVRDSEIGRGLALQAAGALVLALALHWTIGTRTLLGWTAFALAVVAPSALTGHAASGGSHSLASVSLYLHLAAVAVWVGGLIALGWFASHGSRRLDTAVRRYSGLAAICFAVVGVSGVVSAMVRTTELDQLVSSPYGRLVGLKLLAYLALGSFGWWQRRQIINGAGGFRRLAACEVFVMVAAVGVAVALSRTPPPAGDVLLTPAEDLLGGPMPPAPTAARLLFGVYPSGAGLAVIGIGLIGYVLAVLALRRRLEPWPAPRTASWCAGMTVIAWATTGGLGTYSHVLFSAHLANQLLLATVAAPLLVLGAPGSLAYRVVPTARLKGEVSPRDVLGAVAASRIITSLTHPIIAVAIAAASVSVLYFTPLFTSVMSSLLGHLGMELAALGIGLLLFTSFIGSSLVHPRPARLRTTAAVALTVFTACFAVVLHATSNPVGQDYWRALDRPFATDLLADQSLAAALVLAIAAPPLVMTATLLLLRNPRNQTPSPGSPRERHERTPS